MPNSAPDFGEIVRDRLRFLIESKRYTLTGLARAMGRSHMWILRKLDPKSKDPRPLDVEDVGEVLAFLGEPASVLLAPAEDPRPDPSPP